MKILELRFKNLNSLYGEWFIDFTDPEYGSNGIFALTGPTGAGKSTILDAICLALYGATPRLGKITKSGNEIMSRQTGECYSEVMFESQAGRFRCHWGQHRARKKADGNLIDARHEISDVVTGKPIETKKSLVSGIIEEKTGMDFDRFTRSILLAQGDFDTFLKANVEQKSKILEQITGTEIYTEISRRVHERHRDEREKLNVLKAETSGIAILTPEQEKEIGQNLEDKQSQETGLANNLTETGKAIAWLTGIEGLKEEIVSLSEKSGRLKIELESFTPERERLRWAIKASEFDGAYATLTAVRKQQDADQSAFNAEAGMQPKLEASAEQKRKALKVAEQKILKAKEDLKTAAPLIQKVRSLDQKLEDKKKSVENGKTDCRKEAAQIEADGKRKLKAQNNSDKTKKNLKVVEDYLKAHSCDAWLVSGLAGIEEQLGNLLIKQKEINKKVEEAQKAEEALKLASEKFNGYTKQLNARKQTMEDAVKSLEKGKMNLSSFLGNRMLREYRTQKETLLREMAFLTKISELETHRAKLEDGKPCPLCGAKEHPFAEGNVPVPDETERKIDILTELIQKAEKLETVIKKLEAKEKEAQKNWVESEKLKDSAANEKKPVEKSLTDLAYDIRKLRSDFADLKKAVLIKLQPLGIEEIPDSDVSRLIESLQKKLREWQDQGKKNTEIEKKLSDLDYEMKRIDAVIETRSKTLTEKQTTLDSVKQEFKAENSARQKLFGTKSPDTEETGLNKALTDAEQAEKKTRTDHNKAQQKLNSIKANISSLKQRIENRVSELKQLESEFVSHLRSAGFTDEKHLIEARLTISEKDKLKLKAKNLDDRQTDMMVRQKDRESRLSIELAKGITDSELKDLEPQFKELEENLKLLRDSIARLKHQLVENTAAKERIKGKQASIEAQQKECHRWEKLHGLIGSSDGKKYRNFAQGLTFELMVSHANRQLEKMTDRYLLARDKDQPLQLNVMDNYQAGEIRSTKNLSGGESFIVSLALALGLSKMASRKVRVDSLFLDEGFGTLDDEALETALETLSGLNQDGKLIGVISHVSALKDRISTQISINPLSGGKSAITGPGCRKVIK
ncbi:MAG: AAA family ATPase [Desulfobacula sp.]|uniref:AAA family ATPase n=3 Tax=Desulfobacula sp. TaxID=2593537 RepID=UPI0039B89E0B|nr:AAA family ATPase [Desulfobacula sp.]